MQTITIKIKNAHAFRMLEELEALHLIEMVRAEAGQPKKKLSERLAGSLTNEQADRMREELRQSRDEWERDL